MTRKRVMLVSAIWVGAALAISVQAADSRKSGDAGVRKDIANHRAMAEAHSNAASCLESGKPEKECHAQLEKDCKGVAIGKHCGMKHAH